MNGDGIQCKTYQRYRKAGFRFTHTEKAALTIRGETKDLNWYEIGKEDYDRE